LGVRARTFEEKAKKGGQSTTREILRPEKKGKSGNAGKGRFCAGMRNMEGSSFQGTNGRIDNQ